MVDETVEGLVDNLVVLLVEYLADLMVVSMVGLRAAKKAAHWAVPTAEMMAGM